MDGTVKYHNDQSHQLLMQTATLTLMLNPNPTNPNRPTKKVKENYTAIKLKFATHESSNKSRPIMKLKVKRNKTRRPASGDRTARRQFQATGQPVSQTQATDAMTARLPRYEANCVQRRCFQWGSVPLRSDIKGTGLPPCQYILIQLERQLIALQL